MTPTSGSTTPSAAQRIGLWALRALAVTCLCLSIYLAWLSVTHEPVVGCGNNSLIDCDHVLGSSWSRWLGIPVALLGVAIYAAILLLSVLVRVPAQAAHRWSWYALILLGSTAATSAAWFIGLQMFVLDSICTYCFATHVCGIVVAVLIVALSLDIVAQRPPAHRPAADVVKASLGLPTQSGGPAANASGIEFKRVACCVLAGTAMAMVLAGGQVAWPGQSHREFATVDLADVEDASTPAANDLAAVDPPLLPRAADAISDDVTIPDSTALGGELAPRDASDHNVGSESRDSSATSDGGSSLGPPSQNIAATEPGRPTRASSVLHRKVDFIQGQLTVDVSDHPLLGMPHAPNMILDFVDYTCPTCRELHKLMKQGRTTYGEQLAVIVLVVPLHPDCNPLIERLDEKHTDACRLARLALAVWHFAPEAFPGFHNWLMDGSEARSWEDAVARAGNLVDPQTLGQYMQGPRIDDQLRDNTAMFARVGAKTEVALPIHIVKSRVLVGAPRDPQQLFDIWERELGVVRHHAADGSVQ